MSYVKYNSIQAGPFTQNNNLVNFDINGRVTDLSKSYCNLHFEVGVAGALAGSVVGYYLNKNVQPDENTKLYNSDIVKNFRLDSEVVGNIEDIRNVNVLQHNLKNLTQSEADETYEESYECSSLKRSYGETFNYQQPINVQLNTTGTTVSKYIIDPIMKIKYSDFCLGNGKNPRFPADVLGKMRPQMELDPSLFGLMVYNPMTDKNYDYTVNLAPTVTFAAQAVGAGNNTITSNSNNLAGATPADKVAAFVALSGLFLGYKIRVGNNNATAAGGGYDEYYITGITGVANADPNPDNVIITLNKDLTYAVLVGSIIYNTIGGRMSIPVEAQTVVGTNINLQGTFNLDNIPVYVGMPIRIPRQGGANTNQVISSVVLGTNGVVTITVPTVTTTVLVAGDFISFYIDGITPSISYTRAEMVMKEFPKLKTTDKVLKYFTYTTEEADGPATGTSYQKLFLLEPECVNCLVTYPLNGTLISNNVQLEKYRLRINNIDTTNRDINLFSPLYIDRLIVTMLNSGLTLKSTRFVENRTTDGSNGNGTPLSLLATPTPMTQNPKQLQVNLSGTGALAMDRLILFKQVMREIKL